MLGGFHIEMHAMQAIDNLQEEPECDWFVALAVVGILTIARQ